MAGLPIEVHLPEIVEALRRSPAVVIKAAPGAGKTTGVPPAILDAGLAGKGRIVVLEPRRIAARAAAKRMAFERGSPLGEEVGYQIRFERRFGETTRIVAVTEGILTRWLQRDPFLEGVSCVLLDEFHERSIHTDLALALLKEVQSSARPDLKLGVMSATMATEAISAFLDHCPVVDVPTAVHPLEIVYRDRRDERPIPLQAAEGIRRALLQGSEGDILVFLPGMAQIRNTAERLLDLPDVRVLPLHGSLPAAQQDAALSPQDRRKIILSTNLAETSLTIEGVDTVVDSGYARVLRHDPRYGMDRLELTRISRASADQRAGRAARLGPGRVFRLWTRSEHAALPERLAPEIQRVDLCRTLLEVLSWGRVAWFEEPPEAMVMSAKRLLHQLGAVDGETGRLTELGRTFLDLPLHPRLARIVVEAARRGCLRQGAVMAAHLGEGSREVMSRFDNLPPSVQRVADQIERIAKPHAARSRRADEKLLRRLLLRGYPDRVARQRAKGTNEYLMVGGRGAVLAKEIDAPELIVAVDVEGGTRGRHASSLIRMAFPIERDWLENDLHVEERFFFDEERMCVVGTRKLLFDDLPLEERALSEVDAAVAAGLLEEAAARRMNEALTWNDAASRFLARVRCLREWMPELELPAFQEEEMGSLLPRICAGKRSFAETRKVELLPLLRHLLTAKQHVALKKHAPESIALPGDREARLSYEPGRPPELKRKVQDLFGLKKTPFVAGGRVAVRINILGPNFRTVQITEDLENFWKTTYAQVRKDLRGRYPKHRWPEDPV